jgi:hypothetical protein
MILAFKPTKESRLKFLFLALALISFQALSSEALTTDSMTEVIRRVEEKAQQYGKDQVLLVLDIDNTILTATNDLGSDQWYSWQEKIMTDPGCKPACVSTNVGELIEAQGMLYSVLKMRPTEVTLAEKIKALQAKGFKVILLTSRGHDFRSLTEKSLAQNGMDFSTSSLRPSDDVARTYLPYDLSNASRDGLSSADIQVANLKEARPVSFQSGLYMTSGQNKGVMLKVLLNRYKKSFKAIVFADDHQRHVDRMQAIMGTLTDLTTYRYAKMDPEVQRFNNGDKTAVINGWATYTQTLRDLGF